MTVTSRSPITAIRSRKTKVISLNLDRLCTILAATKLFRSKPKFILGILELPVNPMQIATFCFAFKVCMLFFELPCRHQQNDKLMKI